MDTLYSNCRSCRGTGKVFNKAPEWQAFHQAEVLAEFDYQAGMTPEPEGCGPMVFDCAECEGKGIKLTAAGEEVAVLFRRLGMTFTPPRSRTLLNINTWYINNARAAAQ